jgi:3-keto-disaccharide hydrolase
MLMRNTTAIVAVLVTACLAGDPAAQQGGRGRGGPPGPQPLPFEDHTGFTSIFDGSTLKGWDGDTKFWRAEGGAIVGQTTAENPLKENSFIIWRGGEPADFELKVEYRINATNSGIQIRSVHLPAGTQQGRGAIAGNWVLQGYQCDIDAENRFTGQIYE